MANLLMLTNKTQHDTCMIYAKVTRRKQLNAVHERVNINKKVVFTVCILPTNSTSHPPFLPRFSTHET